MQIHELDTYIGTPSETDFMAVDDGTETFKIPLPNVGVSTQMTIAEAEAGTETAPRVITPAVLNSFVESEVNVMPTLVIEVASFSSLPQTVTNESITADMVVVNSVLGTPSAQTGDWTVTTANGSATITGSISGETSLTLYLMKSR
jgi:hypothetical protein